MRDGRIRDIVVEHIKPEWKQVKEILMEKLSKYNDNQEK
jgi:hypothetical protein